jgi:catechol 2,3-dioxygenase-like lactoylglutathione lyase family enzyme
MIRRLLHTSVYVLDQDRAKKFYTEKLGFEVRADATMGDFRWLAVGPKSQPDLDLVLMPIRPGMMMTEEVCAKLRSLVEGGYLGAGVFETADCKKTYEELKSRGVEFKQEPSERPYGVEAVFRDDSGNWFSLTERRGM